MNGLRPLLRLEEKVAAEGRRIQNLGGPPMRSVGPMVLIAALSLHGAILLLPAVRYPSRSPAGSPVPSFPRVWRAPLPSLPPPQPAERPSAAAPAGPTPAPGRTPAPPAPRAFSTEPVPEPAPELALNTISADVEPIIPSPDAPPPSPELGPPSRNAPPTPADVGPALLESVKPVYPVAARTMRAEGRVTLWLAVLPDGTVGRATVEDCSRKGLGFEAAALQAVKRWRYEPAPPQSGARRVLVSIHFQQEEARP